MITIGQSFYFKVLAVEPGTRDDTRDLVYNVIRQGLRKDWTNAGQGLCAESDG